MFIAMNRFRVRRGSEAAFEKVWQERETHLETVEGFLRFHLLRGPSDDEASLYASHSSWRSRADFEGWTRSEQFRAAHRGAGDHGQMYLGHPQLETFEVIQTVG